MCVCYDLKENGEGEDRQRSISQRRHLPNRNEVYMNQLLEAMTITVNGKVFRTSTQNLDERPVEHRAVFGREL